jgi:hypothetical protein
LVLLWGEAAWWRTAITTRRCSELLGRAAKAILLRRISPLRWRVAAVLWWPLLGITVAWTLRRISSVWWLTLRRAV